MGTLGPRRSSKIPSSDREGPAMPDDATRLLDAIRIASPLPVFLVGDGGG